MEKLRPMVSVIMLTRNRSKIIMRSVKSVLAQNYNNFEFIIMDASDNEETNDLIRQIDDSRIKYNRVLNEKSVYDTLQNAIKLARGQYIAFNDDDDEWISPEKLDKQVSLMELLPSDYGVVYCWWEIMYDETGEFAEFEHKTARGNVFNEMLYDNAINGTPSLMIKREVFDTVDCISPPKSVTPSDHLMLTKISKNYKFDFVPDVLVRCHEQHGYGSQGRIVSERFTLRHRVNLQLEFLRLFEKDYAINNKARKHKYETIVSQAIKGRYFALFTKYSFKHLWEFKNITYFLRSLLRYAWFFNKKEKYS